ncbi:MAG: helix-turn-helix transcriptional regulator [Fimbriimonadaceae bacterium]|nr:helix-turn-helix transcriptional regulator [Fimbriimonadaceae bacterium]
MSAEAVAVFAALGDGVRATIVERLAREGQVPATSLAEGLPVTRQAVAKHVLVLRASGLVSVRKDGRRQLVSLQPEKLDVAQEWLARRARMWDDRLAALRDLVEGSEG